MRGRRIRPLRAAEIGSLPPPCDSCSFWERSQPAWLTSSRRAEPLNEGRSVKREWAETVERQWGSCGLVATNGDRVIGYLTMAPALLVPRLGSFASTPVSQDAAVVLNVRVVDEYAGHGLGRQLVQAAAAVAVKRDVRALEAIASHRQNSCMVPVGFLEAVGFTIIRHHPLTPRLRMDLQTTVRWRPDLVAAWSRLRSLAVRPAPPEPVGFDPVRNEPVPRPLVEQ